MRALMDIMLSIGILLLLPISGNTEPAWIVPKANTTTIDATLPDENNNVQNETEEYEDDDYEEEEDESAYDEQEEIWEAGDDDDGETYEGRDADTYEDAYDSQYIKPLKEYKLDSPKKVQQGDATPGKEMPTNEGDNELNPEVTSTETIESDKTDVNNKEENDMDKNGVTANEGEYKVDYSTEELQKETKTTEVLEPDTSEVDYEEGYKMNKNGVKANREENKVNSSMGNQHTETKPGTENSADVDPYRVGPIMLSTKFVKSDKTKIDNGKGKEMKKNEVEVIKEENKVDFPTKELQMGRKTGEGEFAGVDYEEQDQEVLKTEVMEPNKTELVSKKEEMVEDVVKSNGKELDISHHIEVKNDDETENVVLQSKDYNRDNVLETENNFDYPVGLKPMKNDTVQERPKKVEPNSWQHKRGESQRAEIDGTSRENLTFLLPEPTDVDNIAQSTHVPHAKIEKPVNIKPQLNKKPPAKIKEPVNVNIVTQENDRRSVGNEAKGGDGAATKIPISFTMLLIICELHVLNLL